MFHGFNLEDAAETAVFYRSFYEEVAEWYEDDPEVAGELAIAMLQIMFTGDTTSDNKWIKRRNDLKDIAYKNRQKYLVKQEVDFIDKQYQEIADMTNAGKSQQAIGDALGIPQRTVSYRLNHIRTRYPYLLKGREDTNTQSEQAGYFFICFVNYSL